MSRALWLAVAVLVTLAPVATAQETVDAVITPRWGAPSPNAIKLDGIEGVLVEVPFLDSGQSVLRVDSAALEQLRVRYGHSQVDVTARYNAVIGAMPVEYASPEFEARLADARRRLGAQNVWPALPYSPELMTRLGESDTQAIESGQFRVSLFDRVYGVRSVEEDLSQTTPAQRAQGERAWRVELDKEGGLGIFHASPSDPENPASPLIVRGDVMVGPDVYRVLQSDPGEPALVQRLVGARNFADHDGRAADNFAISNAICPSPSDNVIRVGWAISESAARELQESDRPTIFDVTPSQIRQSMTLLTAVVGRHGVDDIQFQAVSLFDKGQAWEVGGLTTWQIHNLVALQINDPASQFGGIWGAARARDTDIVVLIVDQATKECGWATVHADAMTAFAVVNQSCMWDPRFTLAHEIGHVVGGCHERDLYDARGCGPANASTNRYAWIEKRRLNPPSGWLPNGDLMASWYSYIPDDPRGFVRQARFSAIADGPTNFASLLPHRLQRVSAFARCRR